VSVVPGPRDEAELHAYADGRLPPERTAAVEAWLADDAAARERVALWRHQSALIAGLYGGPATQPLPMRLRPERLARGRRRALRRLAAAAVAALLVGGGAGWFARGVAPMPEEIGASLARDGARVHRAYAGAPPSALDVDASDGARLAGWLSRRLGHQVRAPDLAPVGLRLLGGRELTTAAGETAAQLVYEGAAGARFTLYLVRVGQLGPDAFSFFRTADANTFYWPYEELRCVLAGDTSPDRLLEIAQAAYEQVESDEATGS
jgi:anti-sigma factor RsiW